MPKDDFQLLQGLSTKLRKGHAPLAGVKEQTKKYLELHNKIVERIWELENSLEYGELSDDLATQVSEEVNRLTALLNNANSQAMLREIFNLIIERETELTGSSKVDMGSP